MTKYFKGFRYTGSRGSTTTKLFRVSGKIALFTTRDMAYEFIGKDRIGYLGWFVESLTLEKVTPKYVIDPIKELS